VPWDEEVKLVVICLKLLCSFVFNQYFSLYYDMRLMTDHPRATASSASS
jgi:hypothetical protein